MQTPDSDRQLVVLGSSAGGIEALTAVLERIPPQFGAPIVIAQHLDPRRPSHLATILQRRSQLPVAAVDGETELEAGHAYILPPDQHFQFTPTQVTPQPDGTERPTPSIDHVLTS